MCIKRLAFLILLSRSHSQELQYPLITLALIKDLYEDSLTVAACWINWVIRVVQIIVNIMKVQYTIFSCHGKPCSCLLPFTCVVCYMHVKLPAALLTFYNFICIRVRMFKMYCIVIIYLF